MSVVLERAVATFDELSALSAQQAAQIRTQLRYHQDAPLAENFLLLGSERTLEIYRNVTRPMSSKQLPVWLEMCSEGLVGKRVLDLGCGAGIQGISALILGAESCLFTDINACAVENAQANVAKFGLQSRAKFQVSDLFDTVGPSEFFDLVIFTPPYFEGRPLASLPESIGMLSDRFLTERFLAGCSSVLSHGGRVVSMAWPFAGDSKDLRRAAHDFQFKVTRQSDLNRIGSDVQLGRFVLFELERI